MKKQDKIQIGTHIYVNETMPYKERAEKLLEIVKMTKADKEFILPKGIESLIGAGAKIQNLNRPQHGGSYFHEVVYKNHIFISITNEKFAYSIYNHLMH